MQVNNERMDAVLEIGTEELPARFIGQILADATEGMTKRLEEARLGVDSVISYATPRRIIVALTNLAASQRDLVRELRGPAARIAYDADGKPTKALEGFARSAGVSVDAIERRSTDSGEYVFASAREEGKPAAEVLAQIFPQLIASFSFPKSMRWGSYEYRFVRPIRWILALCGTEVVKFNFHNLASGRATYGHRTLAPDMREVPSSQAFPEVLESMYVMYDQSRRAGIIKRQAGDLATAAGGEAVMPPELLDEVVNLVEWPTAFSGSFDRSFLELPEACVTTPMVDHQRYFPVRDGEGCLLPVFIGVRNGGDRSLDTVRAGNERVLAARLADAVFFYKEDMETPLERRTEDLKGVMFQEKLGTMYDKAARVGILAMDLLVGTPHADLAEYAGMLAKADLVTAMVREFTELQGVIGKEYALRQGIAPEVAEAIFEHYLPRFAGDALPASPLGAALAVADKIDTIVGYFGIGLIPSGSADPYALRRQASGILAVHAERRFVQSLDALATHAAQLYVNAGVLSADDVESVRSQVLDFIATRLRVAMEEAGIRYDIADAALSVGIARPACSWERAWAISEVVREPWFATLATAASRVRNISIHATSDTFTPGLFAEEAEHELYKAMRDLEAEVRTSVESRTSGFVDREAYTSALERMSQIVPVIDRYFEGVMVMVDDERVRANRLGMLNRLHGVLSLVVDLSRIVFAADAPGFGS